MIGAGYQIPFHTTPPTTNLQQHWSSVSKEDEKAVEEEIAALLDKQAIEPATAPGFRSRLFTIVKKTGDLRPVLNLRPLNQYVEHEFFKMKTTKTVCSMILKNDFLTSIDLKDAFLHVPIAPTHRKYLQFQWKGKTYQFRTLPFGLSLSPLVFTKILRPLLRWARRKGIRLSAYLDDLLIMGRTVEQSRRNTQLVREKLMALGFIINEKKSSLELSQSLDHLGFTFDTPKMMLSVPKSKLRDLRREATKMKNKGHTTLKNLTSFVGKAMATTLAVFPARLMTRNLLSLKNSALRRPQAQWTDTVMLTTEAEDNLNWWISQPQRMERQLLDTVAAGDGHIHGCLGSRLGHSDRQQELEWGLVTRGSQTPHQLERDPSSLPCSHSTSSSVQNGERYHRQHQHTLIHQQVWRHEITATDGGSRQSVATLPSDRDKITDDIRSFNLQP